MDHLREEVDGVQWALSSPTSCASPIEFAVGSSQWSLKPIADSSCRQSLLIAAPGDSSLGVGPQWTFQHVDSTFRNTILSHSSRASDSGPTPFPISRKPSLPSSNQRPSIIIDNPATLASEMETRAPMGPISAMFPPRERIRGLDSPMLGLFDTLLPLSPALSSNQLRLVPPRAWSPVPNGQLQPPGAGSGTSTPRPPSALCSSTRIESNTTSEPEETPSLRQTLDSLDQRLCELLEERKLVQNRLARAASKLSPISRLPPEIIARIFECGVNAGGRCVLGSGTHGLFMGAVRRVSKLWREIAESTPSLWSSIIIDMHNSLESTELRLKRSRCAPLDIQVVFTDRVTSAASVTSTLTDAFNLLRPHMQRWRSLRLQIPYVHARAVLTSLSGPTPCLKEFSFHVNTPKMTRNIRELPWMLEDTTSLTTLSLSSVDFGWSNAALYFRNLSSIYLSDYWASSAPSSLQLLCLVGTCAATLTDLTLRNMSDCDSEEEQILLEELRYIPQIMLPRLKRATFYFSGFSRLSVLLSRVAFPSLEYLEISYLDDASVPVEMLCEQKDGHLPLKTLIINSSLIMEEQLVRLLHKVPELTSLELADCEDVSPFLLNELSNAQAWLCPNLRLLSIDGCTSVDSQAVRILEGFTTLHPARCLFSSALKLRARLTTTTPRCAMLRALVDYSDDSEDENTQKEVTKTHNSSLYQPKRKNDLPHRPNSPPKKAKQVTHIFGFCIHILTIFRALPALDASLFTPSPIDDPSKHQGRKRTIPYVEGQFIAHVYVPIKLQGDFLALLRRIVGCAQSDTTAWHSLLENVPATTGEQTPSSASLSFRSHLSLSRPVPLRAHQRDGFRKEVRKAALERTQFVGSFAQLTTLTNEDQSRTFLCVEIGAGHNEFHALSQSLSAHLASLRQLPYYPQPRFHISIAWMLTHNSPYSALAERDQGASATSTENRVGVHERTPEPNVDPSSDMSSLIEELRAKFSKQLLDLGRFDVQIVEVKIGKDIHRWPLATRI
ncbi:Eukaryotic translation initiation factor 3 subunit A [Rhizoctonia solani]|uniref:U6 snRNA phosphodiesterase 1 n=1 Tax=Rhizoctonia solani TaxID=456999 RepID=A0A0K6FRG2_9AGAM|nr:Eukaryotic translation initiation factor 3 subunit A [Rhizoctonia solani]